ncbi:MAG: Calx-beta domain-containing protein [Caldilineaceae bacterium]
MNHHRFAVWGSITVLTLCLLGKVQLSSAQVQKSAPTFPTPATHQNTRHTAPNTPGDTTPPTVNWTSPVGNDQVYPVTSGIVGLEVSATDINPGVEEVDFERWDAVNNVWVSLDFDATPPYQSSVDVSTLNAGWNQINATAYDLDGNFAVNHIWIDKQTALPTVQFGAATLMIDENGTMSDYQVVTLSKVSSQPVSVHYRTSDGTATAGSDYTTTDSTVTFPPGATSVDFYIPILDDTLDEDDETIKVKLSNPTNATLGALTDTTLTIIDNDPSPTVQFNTTDYSVGESGGEANIQVTLSAVSGRSVNVNYATSNGTATAGSDYTAKSGALTFNPGETSKAFRVPIIDDTLTESNETVNVALSTPSNATLGAPANATLTIVDNDQSTTYTISGRVTSNSGAALASVDVIASGPTSLFATTDGSGNYTIKGLAAGNYTVLPTKNGYTFAPASRSVTVAPNATNIDFTGTPTQASLPDLVPYQAPSWEFPVVPSSVQGTTSSNTLYAGQPTYFDWGVKNQGNPLPGASFYVDLLIDGTQFVHYPFSADPGTGIWLLDWNQTVDTPGWHTVKIVVDSGNVIREADETNNTWEHQFYWQPAGGTNHAPVANDQDINTPQDTAKSITLTAADPDNDPLIYSLMSNPSHGSLSGTPPTVTYTPAPGFNGADSFTFRANDGQADSNIATIRITVSALSPCYLLTLSANPSAGGAVVATPSPNCQGNLYTQGTVVSLSATANAGYTFSQWSGAANGNANPLTVTMDGAKNITANFNLLPATGTVCGQVISGVSCTGGIGFGYPIFSPCGANSLYLWQPNTLPADGFYRIHDATFAALDFPLCIQNRGNVTSKVANWSQYESIASCAVCEATQTYAISGRVTNASNAPISGITISDGVGHTAPTDSNGSYTLSGLPAGNYVLAPSKDGYTFSPTSRTITVPPEIKDVNFIGASPQSDLEVTALEPPNITVCSGAAKDFNAFVRNNGATASGVFDIQWNHDGQSVDIHTENTSISSGGSLAYRHIWTDITLGQHSLTFIADATNKIAESNEGNNQRTINFTAVDCSGAADVRITDFTLADQAPANFPTTEQTHVLKQNTLWIRVTNNGQTAFNPTGGAGQYELQVVLKKRGEKLEQLEEQIYLPGEFLPGLQPNESRNLRIGELFLFTQVQDGELEIFLKPDSSLNLPNSILTKTIRVDDHPDSYFRCAVTVAKPIIFVAKLYFPQFKVALEAADLANRILKCGVDGVCLAKQCSIWAIGLGTGYFKDARDVLKMLADVLVAMGEPPPCIKVSDLVNAWLHEAFRSRLGINGIVTESPVYPLMTNKAGQRTGFLNNGQIVEEIPNSRAVQVGEKRIILYSGENDFEIQIAGYAAGTMNLFATFAQKDGSGVTFSYKDVQVTQIMKATVTSIDQHAMLKIDTNGDGTFDQSLPADEVEYVFPANNSYMPLVIK